MTVSPPASGHCAFLRCPHTREYLKRQATRLKKSQGWSHHEALDIVSKIHGYVNWNHFVKCKPDDPRAT